MTPLTSEEATKELQKQAVKLEVKEITDSLALPKKRARKSPPKQTRTAAQIADELQVRADQLEADVKNYRNIIALLRGRKKATK